MKRVFADSFFYIALLNRHDAAHGRALDFVVSEAAEVVTTVPVVLEVADAMAAPARRHVCGAFLADLAGQTHTTIRQIDNHLLLRGLDLYRGRPDKGWSLTDCISFVVMADERLTEALTGDHHFEQAGFRALLID